MVDGIRSSHAIQCSAVFNEWQPPLQQQTHDWNHYPMRQQYRYVEDQTQIVV